MSLNPADETFVRSLAGKLPEGLIAPVEPRYLEDPRRRQAGHGNFVARPRSTEEVAAIVRACNAARVGIVPYGGGTGLVLGQLAGEGPLPLILSLERMAAIRAVYPEEGVLIAEAGVILEAVHEAATGAGRLFPLTLASQGSARIGGLLSTNAGGVNVVRYGNARDLCLGIEAVLPDGSILKGLKRLRKDNSGYDVRNLLVGAEGTLGIITEVTVRLLPAQPPASTVVGTFASVGDASRAVLAITGRIRPAMLEFMDAVSINAVEDMLHMDLDRSAGALLVAQSDAPGEAGAAEIAIIEQAFRDNGAGDVFSTDDPDEGEMFTAARRAAIPAVERLGSLLLEDVGVPLPQLPTLVEGVAAIAAQRDVVISVIAHAGDGNTHPLIVFDPADSDQTERAHLAFGEVMELAISLGGTITGEHGVGRLKKGYLAAQVGDDVMELTRTIKQALDPQGLLNPGVML